MKKKKSLQEFNFSLPLSIKTCNTMINELSYTDFYGFMVLSQSLNKAEEMIHIPELNLLKHMLCQEIKTEKTH